MEKRKFGNTGIELSIIGFGGIVIAHEEQAVADRYVAEAIDEGINYFDVAPIYADAQDRMGPALRGKRNNVFLACKTEKRTAKEAEEAIAESLRKLETDNFDLFQLHGIASMEEAEKAMGPGGAIEAIFKAREKGYIKHIGFSAHSEEAALWLMEQYNFESVLFPMNWVCILNGGFGLKIINKAIEKGAARLALKAMAKSSWPEGAERDFAKCWYEPVNNKELALLALRYTLSQPVTAAVPPGDIRLFRWALEAARSFKPVSEEEIEYLKHACREVKPLFV